MRFAYADPPYIGQAKKHYGDDPNSAEVDHVALIAELETYDGWALSCSEPSLKYILSICPDGVRTSPWVKPWCSWKKNVNPAHAWEPIIWKTPRPRTKEQPTIRDYVSANATTGQGVHGRKPDPVSYWLFETLNLQPGDTFDDLFPGSGAVGRAFSRWQRRLKWEAA